jgi:hypothetical protein
MSHRTASSRRSVAIVAFVATVAAGAACSRPSRVPQALTDDEFRTALTAWSEPAGEFVHAGNLVSNETHFPDMIRLLGTTRGVYIGVGPEQNFSYIAGVQPEIAFIVDIRKENRDLHLLYKALFEVSGDRAEFLARLFSRERPAGLGTSASVAELFAAIAAAPSSSARCEADVRVVAERLDARRLQLTAADHESIAFLLRTFCARGPAIRYETGDLTGPTYGDLMGAVDLLRRPRSYLASEDAFAYVKDLHARNLIVPLIGDFAGPRALAAVGEFARRHEATVRVFYGSNVEVYLSREQSARFCRTLSGLPHDSGSWFIGNKGMRTFQSKLEGCPSE